MEVAWCALDQLGVAKVVVGHHVGIVSTELGVGVQGLQVGEPVGHDVVVALDFE